MAVVGVGGFSHAHACAKRWTWIKTGI
jgi:hypothetical protein